ncbi:MAG: PorV/PorQ family protein [Chlorobi bacterium]|nr:PorV/PorQ family protein [Chlorobiota bacterium]
MKRLIVFLLLTMTFLGMGNKMYAQGESAVPFLLLAPDSRAGGMGETGAGLADNSAAIFWNPAGLAFQTGSEVSITHSNWLPQFNLDIFYDFLTYKMYVPEIEGTVSTSVTFMNFGEFVRTDAAGNTVGTFKSFDGALTLGYATKLGEDWGLGMNFRLIHSRLSTQGTAGESGEGTATSVSFDIGGMWRPKDFLDNRLSIGLNISNIGPEIYYIDEAQADPIPTNFRLGFAGRIFENEYNSFTVTADFSRLLIQRSTDSTKARDDWYKALFSSWGNDNVLREFVSTFGLEYWYGVPEDFMFSVRAGFFYEDPAYGNRKFLTAGAGLRYDMYGFDFSYLTTSVFDQGENHPLNNTLRFTLLIGWGAQAQKTPGLPRGI